MKIKAILFGSTGMIGRGVLLECLENNKVESVLVVNRNSCDINHPKLKEVIHENIYDLSSIVNELKGYNTCFFCIGVSVTGYTEREYYKITFELTTYVAKTILSVNNDMTFCYITGQGTDSSEKGRLMWARVKGKTENALMAMPFKKTYIFRPGFIQPLRGLKSRTKIYNLVYIFFKPFYFIFKHFENYVTNSDTMSKAMINAVATGYDKSIIENKDINILGRMK
jgi:hypothetical protein